MRSLLLLLFLAFSLQAYGQNIFQPGNISLPNVYDDYISLNSEENFLVFTRFSDDYKESTIYYSKKVNGEWGNPEIAPFSGEYNDSRPFISPKGNQIFFASDRPVVSGGERKDLDIWYVEKKREGWSEPIHTGDIINSSENESHPSVAENGNIYFMRWSRGQWGDIYLGKADKTGYQKPEPIDIINTEKAEGHPVISPDESILFYGALKEGENNNGEVFMIVKKRGKWSTPINLEWVNSDDYDYSAKLSASKKRIYFSRTGGGERTDIYYLDINWSDFKRKFIKNAVFPQDD